MNTIQIDVIIVLSILWLVAIAIIVADTRYVRLILFCVCRVRDLFFCFFIACSFSRIPRLNQV